MRLDSFACKLREHRNRIMIKRKIIQNEYFIRQDSQERDTKKKCGSKCFQTSKRTRKKNLARNIQLVHVLYDSPPISFLAMNFPYSSLECDFRENYMHINIYEIAVKIERTEEKSWCFASCSWIYMEKLYDWGFSGFWSDFRLVQEKWSL